MAADGYYTFTGRDGEVIPPGVTRVRIHESLTVIPAQAFDGNIDIEELECHDRVKKVEESAFAGCTWLRIVIMRGVEVVEDEAFGSCEELAIVECGKLERIGYGAFEFCQSLTSINLPSAKTVEGGAFYNCIALMNVEFGKKLESIGREAFKFCTLERVTIPLKDGIITDDNIFQGCNYLEHVNLVEGALHDTIAALLLVGWKNDMKEEINAINQILPYTPAGNDFDDGGKAQAVRIWIRSVLRKIIHYKAQHQHLLNEAVTTLQHALPQDIMVNNVLPFLELPSHMFEVGGT
eukprot:scaffold5085_cov175-Skeletonema_marinoi.AAC.3